MGQKKVIVISNEPDEMPEQYDGVATEITIDQPDEIMVDLPDCEEEGP